MWYNFIVDLAIVRLFVFRIDVAKVRGHMESASEAGGDESLLNFGQWVKQRRGRLDLTQSELADSAGCSVFAVRKIESGDRRPSKQLASLLIDPLQIPQDQRDVFVRVARGELPLARLQPELAGVHITPQATSAPKPPPRDNLPVNLNPLVGRENELATLIRYLDDPRCRLLTLVGAGGFGKTRLAMELASACRDRYRDGICFVPLAPVSSSGAIVHAIAGALGYAFQGQTSPRRQLIDQVRDKRMLLVMDNVEHLLDGVDLFTELLAHSPGISLLATSRERLNLQSEWVCVVQGLPVPPSDKLDRAQEYASVQLFVQAAKRASAGYALQRKDERAVAKICQMVEGMPLGIELASAWIAVLSCDEIAREIETSLDFLTTSMRDVPERQRSLEAVFNHSWDLLSVQEREVLRRLAVFRGGFRRDAAENVADAKLTDLYGLVSKSLLRHHEDGRYDLHEVIRQYSLARLEETPEYGEARDRHSDYHLSMLRDRELALKGPAQRDAIRELKDEIENLREAWAWAVSRKRFALVGRALRSFGWFCNVGVLYSEGIAQIDPIVETLRDSVRADEEQAVLGVALAQQGLLYFRRGKFGRAVSLFEESLGRLRPLEEPELLTDALVVYGVILHLLGNIPRAYSLLEEGLACARAVEDRSLEAYALYNLGYLASLQGRYDEGFAIMQDGLALWRQVGDPSATALGLIYLTP